MKLKFSALALIATIAFMSTPPPASATLANDASVSAILVIAATEICPSEVTPKMVNDAVSTYAAFNGLQPDAAAGILSRLSSIVVADASPSDKIRLCQRIKAARIASR